MNTIYASFADPEMAEKATGALLDFGALPEDISLVHSEQATVRKSAMTGINTELPATYRPATESPKKPIEESATMPRAPWSSDDGLGNDGKTFFGDAADRETSEFDYDTTEPVKVDLVAKQGISTTTPEDAAAGAKTGAAMGLGVGAVAALASLFIPGVGLVIGSGALAIAIGGMAAAAGAGAVAGAVTGYLKDQGVDEHIAEAFGGVIKDGGTMIAVNLPSAGVDETMARSILEKYGAMNVHALAKPRVHVV